MEYKNLTCSSCGGSDFQKLSELEYRCNHCHGLLVRTTPLRDEPEGPEPTPIPVASWPNGDLIVKGVAALFAAIFIIVIVIALLPKKKSGIAPITAKKATPALQNYTPPVNLRKGKLKTEVVGRVKDRFDNIFIKCILTNVGDNVVPDPSTGLVLFKGDTKLDKVYGDGLKKYLKPGEKTPAYISLHKHGDYTDAVVEENTVLEGITDSPAIFPDLRYEGVSMKADKGTTIMNGAPLRENYYAINGTVVNNAYDKINLDLFVVLTDSKGEIVGMLRTGPPELARGEKGKFDVMVADSQLFGTPVKYDLVAVNRDHRSSSLSGSAANKVAK